MGAPDLPNFVVDPQTHEPLRSATDAELAELVARGARGSAKRQSGASVGEPRGAYIRASGLVVYLVEDGVPNFVIEERVELTSPLSVLE